MRTRLNDSDHSRNFEQNEQVDRDFEREPSLHRRPRGLNSRQLRTRMALGWAFVTVGPADTNGGES